MQVEGDVVGIGVSAAETAVVFEEGVEEVLRLVAGKVVHVGQKVGQAGIVVGVLPGAAVYVQSHVGGFRVGVGNEKHFQAVGQKQKAVIVLVGMGFDQLRELVLEELY